MQKSDQSVVMVADTSDTPQPAENYTVYNVPGWDWSLVDLSGINLNDSTHILQQLKWNGTNLIKK